MTTEVPALPVNQDTSTLLNGETLLVGHAPSPIPAMASHYRGTRPLRSCRPLVLVRDIDHNGVATVHTFGRLGPMHSHPLYDTVRAECLCCHLEQSFHFKSKFDIVICTGCKAHQGTTGTQATKRDTQHLQMWQSEMGLIKDEHARRHAQQVVVLQHKLAERDVTIATLNGHVSDLEGALNAGLESRPVEAMAIWYENSKIAEALASKRATQRFSDQLFGYLWQLDEFHHSDETTDLCSCSVRRDKCKELALLDPIRNKLYKWERDQRDRLKAGKEHGLPQMHPDVLTYDRVHRWGA